VTNITLLNDLHFEPSAPVRLIAVDSNRLYIELKSMNDRPVTIDFTGHIVQRVDGRLSGNYECDKDGPLCLPKRYFRIAGVTPKTATESSGTHP
jgi:hypothetical protein